MQEILFKAKTVDTGEWVEGYYVRLPDAAGSVHMMHVPANNPDECNKVFYIDPETLGQFTGMADANGAKIFEGDIIKKFSGNDYAVVKYNDDETEFYADFSDIAVYYGLGATFYSYDIEIIGNIHDNPELIGGAEDEQNKRNHGGRQ